MKSSKMVLAVEVASLLYMAAILWMLFPGWRGPLMKGWRHGLYQWRLGQAQLRLARASSWVREAAVVRGKLAGDPPRPFHFPE